MDCFRTAAFAFVAFFIFSMNGLDGQTLSTGDKKSDLRPHLWLGALGARQAMKTESEFFYFQSDPDWRKGQWQGGPALEMTFWWLRLRTGLQPVQYSLDYTSRTNTGQHGYPEVSIVSQSYHSWDFQAIRIPVSLGLMPSWKVAPYFDAGLLIDVFTDASHQVDVSTTTTITRERWAQGCMCFWTEVTKTVEESPAEQREVEQSRYPGWFADLGLNFRPFERHRLFVEVRYGKGGYALGEGSYRFRLQFRRVALGYAFRVF